MLHKSLPAIIASVMFIGAGGCNRTLTPGTVFSQPSVPAGDLAIDADFLGGNIVVEQITGDTVLLRPDQRDSAEWWFYWYFRVRGAAGRTLRFQFSGRNPIGTQGPAVSTDAGRSWSWLGPQAVHGSSFSYTFDQEYDEVRFCFSIPYREADLQEFLRQYADSPCLAIGELCRTRKDRSVERLHVGNLGGDATYRVLLTARHHACESIASYALEGLVEAVLADTDVGRWFRDNVEVLAIPFVDKDGVEDGDQGKNRRPHDHNRDYLGESIYPSVRAIRRFVPRWAKGKLKVAIDLHCPHISGKYNEIIYMVGSADSDVWRQQQEFASILESSREGPLPYSADSSLPFGTGWNTASNYGRHKSSSGWAAEQAGVRLATTIEIPYANVGTAVVTTDNARAFGHDLARALRRYLENDKQ